MSKEIFEVEFNAQNFVSALDRAIEALNRFENQSGESKRAVQSLGQNLQGVSFTAPVNGLIRTSEAMKQVNFGVLALTDSQKKLAQSLSTNSQAWIVYGTQTDQATTKQKQFNDEAKKTSGFLSNLKSGAVNILGALGVTAGIAGLVQFGKSLINVTAQFQDFRSILTNTLGSARLADNALASIQDFALKTKFSVAEVTDVFIRLANTGFVPTMKELEKLADFSASRGKSINDVAEALIDAQVGQFRRLEEIGPKVQVVGDKVIFTFRGVQQVVDNNQEAIKRYILSIGEMDGVMGQNEATSKNLATSISNLGDQYDKFLLSLSKGNEGIFSSVIGFFNSLLEKFTNLNEQVNTLNRNSESKVGILDFLKPFVGAELKGASNFYANLEKNVGGYTEIMVKTAKTKQDFENIIRRLNENKLLVIDNLQNKNLAPAVEKIFEKNIDFIIESEKEASDKLSKNTAKTDALADAKKQKLAEAKAKKERAERAKQNENYEKELIDYSDKIAKLNFDNSRKSEEVLKIENARLLQVEQAEIDKKFNLLSSKQRALLKASAKEYYDLKFTYDLEAFKENQQRQALEIDEQIRIQREKLELDRIKALPESFNNENEILDAELKAQTDLIAKELQDRENLYEQQYKDGIIPNYERLLELLNNIQRNAILATENAEKESFDRRIKLAQKYFDQAGNLAKNEYEKAQQTIAVSLAQELNIEAKRYENGEIGQREYQLRKTDIENAGEAVRVQNQVDNDIAERDRIIKQNQSTLDAQLRAQNEATIRVLEASILNGQNALATMDAKFEGVDSLVAKIFGIQKADAKGRSKVDAIKGAILDISSSAINILQTQNQAESRAIDFAIRQQERRVQNANRIADAGNAEYLQIEQERLDQLEQKKEESARRQIEINTALQASNVLVAIAGAVAKIATPGVGIADTIASVGVIVASLATGYALVSSIQSQKPSFFQGIDFVPLGNNPKGRDTVPANLHEGEAVIQADKNAKYSPTIKAIRRGLISPDVLNDFVLARVNGRAIEKTIEVANQTPSFGDLTDRIRSLETIMQGTNDSIKKIGVNVNLDADGFSASIENFISKKDKIFKS
jgi:hypothetical protein